MAKMNGPLLSMEARGMIARRYVYQRTQGGQAMRYHWPGAQPITAAQAPHQQLHGWLTHIISFVKQQRPHLNSTGADDYVYLRALAGPEQRWNDLIRRRMMHGNTSPLASVRASWNALTKPQKIAWETEAAARAPGLAAYVGAAPATWPEPVFTPGQCWYLYRWIAFLLSITTAAPGSWP